AGLLLGAGRSRGADCDCQDNASGQFHFTLRGRRTAPYSGSLDQAL
ncbi:MAG: hypothetical protein AVDCRST_MAG23-1885, partial [uncultured Sphingosinicella sp.]